MNCTTWTDRRDGEATLQLFDLQVLPWQDGSLPDLGQRASGRPGRSGGLQDGAEALRLGEIVAGENGSEIRYTHPPAQDLGEDVAEIPLIPPPFC